jgi:ribosome biogenesis GTPase
LSGSGLVLVSHGSHGLAELADGERLDCVFRRSVGRPLCGDRVEIAQIENQSAVVTAIEPRRNEFVRAGARGNKQAIAANLDQVLVVVAPTPEPSRDLLERYLVAVHSLGIRPVIVLNKAECLTTAELMHDSPLRRLDEYRELGYPLLTTSCKEAPGIAALPPTLESQTSILVGQSGVGKSSLVNALLPDLELQTGALSRVTGKGTMTQQEIADGFRDFNAFKGHCRFNDCHHTGEPGCAIREAVDAGKIRKWRYQSYARLLQQAAA